MFRIGPMDRLRIFLIALGCCGASASASAQEQTPLLVDGTQSLYQRILTHPGALVFAEPDTRDQVVAEPWAFSAYYVYGREGQGDEEVLLIGPSTSARDVVGWVPALETIAWEHAIVLAFANPVGRLPVLFFDDQDSLFELIEDENLPVLAEDYVNRTRAGTPPEGAGIISIEPDDTWLDFRDDFYLLPVLDVEEAWLATGDRAKLVEIASIPLQEEAEAAEAPAAEDDPFDVGIMFVIDTTTSMQPYIDEARGAVAEITDRIRTETGESNLSFGLVGFRDNIEGTSGVDYVSRTFAPLAVPHDHPAFLAAIEEVEAAGSSTLGFNEDGLAGLVEAIKDPSWKDFDARFIIFVTDAGMREPPDPRATTGMSAVDVNRLAQEKIISVVSVLLATPVGVSYHERATRQMQALSRWDGASAPQFYSVPEGDPEEFGALVDDVTNHLINQIGRVADGSLLEPDAAADEDGAAAPLLTSLDEVGEAMRLAWLARQRGETPPTVFRAWAPDAALDDLSRSAFEVRVLLSKNQLSSLATALELVLTAGTSALENDPASFFSQLRTVVATAARDPSAIPGVDPSAALPDPDDIPDLGSLLGEWLAGLPYESQLMGIDEQSWLTMGPAEQDTILSTVRTKLRYYRVFYGQADQWIPLAEQAPEGDWVYPIPIALLP